MGTPQRLVAGCISALAVGLLITSCSRDPGKTPTAAPARPDGASQLQEERQRQQQAEERKQREAAALAQGWQQGHRATVACLQGERAQTDGSELRCEEQAYVEQNYR